MAKERKRRGRGEGSIEELPSGKFRAVVSAGFAPLTEEERAAGKRQGKRLKLTETFDRKDEAVTWRNEQLERLKKGTLPRAGKMTVGDWLGEWLPQKKGRVEPASWA